MCDEFSDRYYISVAHPITDAVIEVEVLLPEDLVRDDKYPSQCTYENPPCNNPALPLRKVCWNHLESTVPWQTAIQRELEYKMNGKSVPRVVTRAFVGCTFPAMHLRRIEFVSCTLADVRISNSTLDHVTFVTSKLRGVLFTNCVINEMSFLDTFMDYSRFQNCRVDGMAFHETTDIQNVAFIAETELSGKYSNMTFENVRIDPTVLLQDITFENVDFRGAALNGLDMSRCSFAGKVTFDDKCELCDTAFPEAARNQLNFAPIHSRMTEIVFKEPSARVASRWKEFDIKSNGAIARPRVPDDRTIGGNEEVRKTKQTPSAALGVRDRISRVHPTPTLRLSDWVDPKVAWSRKLGHGTDKSQRPDVHLWIRRNAAKIIGNLSSHVIAPFLILVLLIQFVIVGLAFSFAANVARQNLHWGMKVAFLDPIQSMFAWGGLVVLSLSGFASAFALRSLVKKR